MMMTSLPALFLAGALAAEPASSAGSTPGSFMQAKTFFQTNLPYDPRMGMAVDAVVVHLHHAGIKANLAKPIESWKRQGYPVGRMFFADSDAPNEYWKGRWDGREHPDEVERDAAGQAVLCGGVRPYMLPTDGWTKYLEEMTQRTIEAGAEAILPEEPLAHVYTGYEEAFKPIWEKRFGMPWQAEKDSPAALFMTGMLKSELYARLEAHLAGFTKGRAAALGREIPFILPIHSLYSNTAGRLTAPLGDSLAIPDVHGYIGQIWTGPVKWACANYGGENQSFFTSAYALYDYFVQLADGTGRTCWLLIDPVEDDPDHTWSQFEEWYRHCVVACLLFPQTDRYEVMPWPDRIFMPGTNMGGGSPAPESYRMSILSVLQVLQEVPLGGTWGREMGNVTTGVGVAVADSLMWERNPIPGALSGIYGLLQPLIFAGIPAQACILERATEPGYLDRFRTIVVSYEVLKPPAPETNEALAKWCREGGALLVVGEPGVLDGPFWWNKMGFASPIDHLLKLLDCTDAVRDDTWRVGEGWLWRRVTSPTKFADPAIASPQYLRALIPAVRMAKGDSKWSMPGLFVMRRGPFVIAHVNRERDGEPLELEGKLLDIFDPAFPIRDGVRLGQNQGGVWRDVTQILAESGDPTVLHTTHRLMSQTFGGDALTLLIRGPAETPGAARIATRGWAVKSIVAESGDKVATDADEATVRIQFPNRPEGQTIRITFEKQ